MKKALLFGSIGVLTETSELQRRAYNKALKLNDIEYTWNIGTYCELLKKPGGKKRLSSFGDKILSDEQIEKIHTDKQRIFENLVKDGIEPRPGAMTFDGTARHEVYRGIACTGMAYIITAYAGMACMVTAYRVMTFDGTARHEV